MKPKLYRIPFRKRKVKKVNAQGWRCRGERRELTLKTREEEEDKDLQNASYNWVQ